MPQQGRTSTKKRKSGKGHHKASRHNQKVLLRWIVLIAALLAIIVIAVRCASGGSGSAASEEVAIDESASRVAFTKKGELTVTSVESFDKDYYDEAELQTQIDTEIAAYNEENGNHVSEESLTVESGIATLAMHYDSASDYASFNDEELFWGTLEEAETTGYDLSGLSGQTNRKDESETYGEGTARELAENPVIVLTESLDVITATDILYASENLTVQGDQYATAGEDISASNPAILILATK